MWGALWHLNLQMFQMGEPGTSWFPSQPAIKLTFWRRLDLGLASARPLLCRPRQVTVLSGLRAPGCQAGGIPLQGGANLLPLEIPYLPHHEHESPPSWQAEGRGGAWRRGKGGLPPDFDATW